MPKRGGLKCYRIHKKLNITANACAKSFQFACYGIRRLLPHILFPRAQSPAHLSSQMRRHFKPHLQPPSACCCQSPSPAPLSPIIPSEWKNSPFPPNSVPDRLLCHPSCSSRAFSLELCLPFGFLPCCLWPFGLLSDCFPVRSLSVFTFPSVSWTCSWV